MHVVIPQEIIAQLQYAPNSQQVVQQPILSLHIVRVSLPMEQFYVV